MVDGTSIKIKQARTQFQRKRNYGMRRAEELLTELAKQEFSKTGIKKEVTIEWKVPDTKTRRILFNKIEAFTQREHDGIGTFTNSFASLSDAFYSTD